MKTNNIKSSGITTVGLLILVIIIGILAYFLGKKSNNIVIENIATNTTIIKQISELSSLEVQGNASIKSTNVQNDGSLTDNLRKLFMENTINITVPYIGKYGVDLEKQEIDVHEDNKKIIVSLPQPKLLSYEIKMNKVSFAANRGWLQPENTEHFSNLEQKLYEQSRKQLENNITYSNQAKDKIVKTLQAYYKPTGYTLEVYFADEKYNLQETLNK